MRGADQLAIYGPMTGHMFDVVMKVLGGNLALSYDSMTTAKEVERAFNITYSL